jgi:hypothetical protein
MLFWRALYRFFLALPLKVLRQRRVVFGTTLRQRINSVAAFLTIGICMYIVAVADDPAWQVFYALYAMVPAWLLGVRAEASTYAADLAAELEPIVGDESRSGGTLWDAPVILTVDQRTRLERLNDAAKQYEPLRGWIVLVLPLVTFALGLLVGR